MDHPDREPAVRTESDFEHEVMALCVEAWHSGGPDAVEAVLREHPLLADKLRARIAKLERAGLLAPAEDVAPQVPERLGEFRIVKRLGSGGMGVVFHAEQESLGRSVALKLVRPEQRFYPGARARFRREVEAIARLGDPGIVPIYSVGEDQGIDYFAMEYVRGASVGDVLVAVHASAPAELSGREFAVVAATRAEVPIPNPLPEVFLGTWVQACCRIVVRMARAAQHAHDRGVVHRDLKPNNAMVTPDGRVLLLDFGLAAAAGASRITRTGAMIGTLHYMAPEQLREGDTDARTDVYALGVTLHEMLALRSPFRAESSEALRQQILHGQVDPLRATNSEVPREVQTIVEVAMDRDPARRYQSAAALADDLERFLQHRPIAARPIGAGLRLVRWAQRHPAYATALASALVALLALPFLVKLSRGDAERETSVARENARSNLQSAIVAIEGILQSSRSPLMTRTPGLDLERRRQVESAVELMEKLIRDNGDDVSVRRLYVRGMLRVADVCLVVGEAERALQAQERAEPVLRSLLSESGTTPEHALHHAALLVSRGSALADLGRIPEAARGWREIVDTYEKWTPDAMPAELLVALGTCHNNLGKLEASGGDLDAAIAHFERCLAVEAKIPAGPLLAGREVDNLRTRMNLGSALRTKGDAKGALARYEDVQKQLDAMLAKTPEEPEVRRESARVKIAIAGLSTDRKAFASSIPMRETAIATMHALVADFPDRVQYRQELGQMHLDLSGDRQVANDLPGAEAAARAAVQEFRDLVRRTSTNLEYVALEATGLQQLSTVLYLRKQTAEAMTELHHAIEAQEAVVAKLPDDPHYRIVAAGLLQNSGLYHWNAEHWPEARSEWQRAAAHYEAAIARGSKLPREPRRLPKLLSILAQAELMCDDFEGVVRVLRRLQELQPMPVEMLRDVGAKLHVADRADFQELVKRSAETGSRPK